MELIRLPSLMLGVQSTVECHSHDFQYDERWAGPLRSPQLVHQISSSSCIVNRTWGYNRGSGYIWVANGCAGVFADVGGYHHGRGDTFDSGARHYDERGDDAGAVVAGAVIGAIIAGASSDSNKRKHTTSNVNYDNMGRYNGCHGIGCTVDNPDAERGDQCVHNIQKFDKDGNPNFDVNGNYQVATVMVAWSTILTNSQAGRGGRSAERPGNSGPFCRCR